LASRAAISRTALYQIESGKTELPRAGTLRRIALALDVSMEILLGHGDGVPAALPVAGRRVRNGSEWLPSEGGPLTMPGQRTAATIENLDGSRFGVEAQPPMATPDSYIPARERELAWKLHELLASPLGEGIARIVEESYRMLPQARPIG